MIAELLRKGKENALPTAVLLDMTGVKNVRRLRELVAEERKNGEVILATREGTGGYYLPENQGEVEAFIKTLDKESKSIMTVLKSARRYLKECENQLELDL